VGRPYILSLLVVNFYPFLFPLSLLFLFLSRGRAGLETSRGRVTIGASKGPAHPARPHCCCDWIQYHPPGVPRGLAGSLGMFCPWMVYADEPLTSTSHPMAVVHWSSQTAEWGARVGCQGHSHTRLNTNSPRGSSVKKTGMILGIPLNLKSYLNYIQHTHIVPQFQYLLTTFYIFATHHVSRIRHSFLSNDYQRPPCCRGAPPP